VVSVTFSPAYFHENNLCTHWTNGGLDEKNLLYCQESNSIFQLIA
jgi:hypothetical protein